MATWDSTLIPEYPIDLTPHFNVIQTPFENGVVQQRTLFNAKRRRYRLTIKNATTTEKAAFVTYYDARMADNAVSTQPSGCDAGNYLFVGEPHYVRTSPTTWTITWEMVQVL